MNRRFFLRLLGVAPVALPAAAIAMPAEAEAKSVGKLTVELNMSAFEDELNKLRDALYRDQQRAFRALERSIPDRHIHALRRGDIR